MITQVTPNMIFSKDNPPIKATPEALEQVLNTASENIKYYDRLYEDLHAHIRAQEQKINKLTHPQEINEEWMVFGAYVTLERESLVNLNHWETIARQTMAALNIIKSKKG